jgi:hypothetical protein
MRTDKPNPDGPVGDGIDWRSIEHADARTAMATDAAEAINERNI